MVVKVATFSGQTIANTLNALATSGYYDQAVFDLLCQQALATMAEFKPQELTNTLNALAKCGHYHEPLFAAVCAQILVCCVVYVHTI